MGLNVIHLKDLTPEEAKVMTLDVLKTLNPEDIQNEKDRGQLVVEVNYKPFDENDMPINFEGTGEVQKAPEGTPEGGGVLVVIIHEAQDLEGKHHCNPSVVLHFKGEQRKTKVLSMHVYMNTNLISICMMSTSMINFNFNLKSGSIHT